MMEKATVTHQMTNDGGAPQHDEGDSSNHRDEALKQERPIENENLMDDEESDIVLVEKSYLYITKGT